jgi:hypothetical protein
MSDNWCPGSEPCSLPPLLLPYFRQGVSPTCWHLSCCLFTDGSCDFSSLLLPPSPVLFQQPFSPLLCTSFQFCSLFSFFCLFVCFWRGESVCSGGIILVYPRGGWGIPCDIWLSPVWSAKVFPSMFGVSGQWLVANDQWHEGGGPPVLSMYHGLEKPFTG